jgi:hypothetical protein
MTNTTTTNWHNSTYNFSDGINTVKIYANDTNGNWSDESVTFTVDTALPTITINSPENKTYGVTNISVDITSDGNVTWYEWNGTNYTYTTPLYINFTEGIITLDVYANNSGGVETSESVVFTVNTSSICYFTNLQYNINSFPYEFNATVSLYGEVILEYDGTNYSYLSGNLNNDGDNFYFQVRRISEYGVYNYTWYCNNSAGVWNSTSMNEWNFDKSVSSSGNGSYILAVIAALLGSAFIFLKLTNIFDERLNFKLFFIFMSVLLILTSLVFLMSASDIQYTITQSSAGTIGSYTLPDSSDNLLSMIYTIILTVFAVSIMGFICYLLLDSIMLFYKTANKNTKRRSFEK